MANINFSNVKGVTFNGNTVARILFNGVNVWESGGIETVRKIIGGNWKMNLTGDLDIQNWVNQIYVANYNPEIEVIVFPQACLISKFKDAIGNGEVGGCKIKIGAQLCSENEKGAFTGQNSIDALMACGAEYFLTGHSEAREYLGMTSERSIEQARLAIDKGARAIYCIPLLDSSSSGYDPHDATGITNYFIGELSKVSSVIPLDYICGNDNQNISDRRLTLCYSPMYMWTLDIPFAIDLLCEHEQYFRNAFAEVFGYSRREYFNLIHDGPANPSNIKEQLSATTLQGAIAGGASLKPDYFSDMIEQISNMA